MYMFTLNVELFWSLFVFGIRVGDPVASVGHLAFSFTDRRNSSLRSSDTTGRAFRKSKTTLARAPMVPEHEHLRLTLSRHGKRTVT